MQGWIKLYREVLETDLWYDVTTFRLFTYLLLNATHQDGIKKGGVELKRGQWIRSYRKLAQDLAYKEGRGVKEYSIKTISKCVKKLVDAGTITVEETKQGTLFTIVNYAKYQDKQEFKKETGNASGNEVETNGERSGNNNKNGNNGENVNKEDEEETNPVALYERNFFPLTPMQIESIWDWVDDFKGNQEVICMAIKETALKNPSSPFKYLTRILVDWHKRKLFTLEDVLKAKEQYEKSKVIHLERKKQKQEQPQGRYIPKDAVVDINAGEDPNWTWKKPF